MNKVVTNPKKIKCLELPLTPLKTERSQKNERLRPASSLDTDWVMKQLKSSIVAEFVIDEKHWYLVNVLSSYSPVFHVMLIECTRYRNLPTPEYLDDKEGIFVVSKIRKCLQFLIEQQYDSDISVGYNWSPRAFGQEEEKTGYQSVMRLHFQIWLHPSDDESEYVKWIDIDKLTKEQKRLIDNTFSLEFSKLFETQFDKKQILDSPIIDHIETDSNSFKIIFTKNILELFSDDLFPEIIKPMAAILEKIFRNLTESLTTINCEEFDKLLKSAVEKPSYMNVVKNLTLLRSKPCLKKISEIVESFENHKYPLTLLDEIFEPVQNRCKEEGDIFDMWRKGFGYAWVITGNLKEKAKLHIQTGLYTGSGGVVEAQGMILKRPEHLLASEETICTKNKILEDMKNWLDKKG